VFVVGEMLLALAGYLCRDFGCVGVGWDGILEVHKAGVIYWVIKN